MVLANYALVLELILPMASLQFGQAIGFRMPFKRLMSSALIGAQGNPYLIWSLNSTLPILMILCLLLGAAHLRLALVLLEGDWPRIIRSGALIAAATTTLSLVSGVLMIDLAPLFPQITGGDSSSRQYLCPHGSFPG